jgi:hypothetical protein
VWRSSGPYRAAVLEQEDNESENVRHVGSSAPAGEESPPAAESLIKKLTPELLELVIESAMPGQGPLVPAMHEPPPTTLAPPDAFRVFVHVRPLEFGNGSLGGACSEHALQTMKRERLLFVICRARAAWGSLHVASSRGCSRESLKEMLVCLVIRDGDRHSARVGL